MKFLILLLTFFTSYCLGNTENALKTQLFDTYNRNSMPSSQISLKMGVALRAFNNIDEIDGTLTTNIWLRHFWNDPQLSWNPEKWDNITQITLPTNPELDQAVWTPDIYLYNTAELPMQELDYSLAVISSDGSVLWSRPGIVKSTCVFILNDFPYDEQKCHLKFGSWSYNSLKLNMSLWNNPVDTENYQIHQGWKLLKPRAKLHEQFYNCCPNPFQDVQFGFTLRRNPGYYTLNIILPTFATATLMVFCFVIPNSSGERISFAVTVMLSLIVFLLILSEKPAENKRHTIAFSYADRFNILLFDWRFLQCYHKRNVFYSNKEEA